MNRLNFLLLLFFIHCFQAICQLNGANVTYKNMSYLSDNNLKTQLDSFVNITVNDYMQSPQNCGLSVGIIKGDSTFFYNYGETKHNNLSLPNKNTLFEIGAITKTFCGLVLGSAVSEGKVKLDDDIRLYLPYKYSHLEFKNHFISVKHLANHTSGLPNLPDNLKSQPNYDSLNPYKNYNKQMLFDNLKTLALLNEPGEVFNYSNYGMALLGLILENVYNMPFDRLIKEKICLPNEMNNTATLLTNKQDSLLASGYNSNGVLTPYWELNAFEAAGSIKSCTNDLIKYLNYNINEKDSASKLAHLSTFNYNSNLALAWHIAKTKHQQTLIWHNGRTYGFSSFCGFIKAKKLGVIILSNSATPVDYIAISVLNFLQTH